MENPFTGAGIFLVNVLFDLYLLVLLTRLILFWVGANSFNPVSQFILKITNPIITPFKRFIPNIKKLETATLIIILLLQMIKFFLISFIAMGFPYNLFGLIILAFADSLKLLLETFFYAILLFAILTWIRMGSSQVVEFLAQITAPIMRPFQKFIPPINGIDISPIPALIVLQLIIILVVKPLIYLGASMSF